MPDLDIIDESAVRVPFNGPGVELIVAFEPATLKGGTDFDNFPRATIVFRGHGLWAAAKVYFFDFSLEPFARDLAKAHAALRGEAKLESEDGDFELKIEFMNGDDVSIYASLQPNLAEETVLSIKFDTDQSYLTATIQALQALIRPSQFPLY